MRRLALAVLLVTGCSSTSDPDAWERVVGWVNPFLSSIQAVVIPAEMVAGRPAIITINTLGSSSCTRSNGASVVFEGGAALVTPYDYVAPAASMCTRDLAAFPREVSITFSSAGNKTISVRSRSPDGERHDFDLPVEVRAR